MKRIAASLLAVAAVAVALSASADPRLARTRNVITLKPVDIIGKRLVPIAAVDVSKASPSVAPSELRQRLVDRIDDSVHSTAL